MKKSFWLDLPQVINVVCLFYDIQSKKYHVFLVHFASPYKVLVEEFIGNERHKQGGAIS